MSTRGYTDEEARGLLNGERPKHRGISLTLKIVISVAIVALVAGATVGVVFWVKYDRPNFQQMMFDSIDPSSINATMKELSSYPHIAGSPENYQAAEWVKNKFSEHGIPEVWIESYPVLLNYPLERVVDLIGGALENYSCVMEEKSYQSIDGTSGDPRAVPPFSGYSASGDVTAELVFANYGRIEDYLYLEKNNISIKDKIVIVRYDKIFRGDKVHMAEQRGAAGVLIYHDPADDVHGTVYPYGPWRAPTSVQRGTVWIGNGDPTTPGYPSTPYSPRLNLNQTRDAALNLNTPLPSIPVQPLGYADAEPLLRAIGGYPIPSAEWQGGLNFTYHIGPGPAMVHMKLEMNFTIVNIHNVFAKIPGEIEPDRMVLAGSHRDAWTFGATDPISGTSNMLEAAKGLGKMYANGWRPRRSIVLCSWDGEEYGLIGSVEFTDLHFKELTERAVIYMNMDPGVYGIDFFGASGTPNLRQMMVEVTKQVPGPNLNNAPTTVFDLWSKGGNDSRTKLPTFGTLGAGSDYGGFLQRVGVPSLDISFQSFDGAYIAGAYHSNYDSFYYFNEWLDSTFEYSASLTKVFGLVLKTYSESVVLPFNYGDYAGDLTAFIAQLEQGAEQTFNKTFDEFQIIKGAVERFTNCTQKVQQEIGQYSSLANDDKEYALQIRQLNDRLMLTERAFIDYNGLPDAPFFRHVVYAPSKYNEYYGQAFPAISDSIYIRNETAMLWAVRYNSLFIDGATSFLCPKF